MEGLKLIVRYWDQVTGYLTACWELPWAAPACAPLWTWVALGSIAIGALAVLWTIWKVVDYKLKYGAALKAEAQRQYIPPPEEMDKMKWGGDFNQHEPIEAADPDMAAKIREAIERQKLQDKGLLPKH
ncbi:MAG: hypothetical protein NUV34_03315 [Sulfuricaulis sp.]|nr:hypothetical protein [Sulfuricaulis sp.]